MSEILLNKFEKEKRVIELHLENKTIRDIAKEVRMSFRDIAKIIKAYERKKRLETKREENNQSSAIKKLSTSSRAFILFKEGKKIDEAKVLLDIPFKLAIRYWKQYLKAIGMFEAFEFYKDYQYDIPRFLTINNFIKNNHVNIHIIADILKEATSISGLQLHISILKHEIETLKQTKIGYSLRPL
jgi:hypothetical protein